VVRRTQESLKQNITCLGLSGPKRNLRSLSRRNVISAGYFTYGRGRKVFNYRLRRRRNDAINVNKVPTGLKETPSRISRRAS